MKKLFYFAIGALVLFELANMYFIMPMPLSQRMRSIDVAYFLYTWRWFFRLAFGAMALAGLMSAWRDHGWRKWLVPYALSGRGDAGVLKPLSASQEFWHSWRTFHPGTRTY